MSVTAYDNNQAKMAITQCELDQTAEITIAQRDPSPIPDVTRTL